MFHIITVLSGDTNKAVKITEIVIVMVIVMFMVMVMVMVLD